jgi:hypothetical protein
MAEPKKKGFGDLINITSDAFGQVPVTLKRPTWKARPRW